VTEISVVVYAGKCNQSINQSSALFSRTPFTDVSGALTKFATLFYSILIFNDFIFI